MRLVVLTAAAVVAYVVLRRHREDPHRVAVGWVDGAELELRPGTPERERLVAIAGEVLG